MAEVTPSDFGRLEGKLDTLIAAWQTAQVDAAGRLATLDAQSAENKRRIGEVEGELDDFKATMNKAVAGLATKEDLDNAIGRMKDTQRWVIGTLITLFGLVAVPLLVIWLSHKP